MIVAWGFAAGAVVVALMWVSYLVGLRAGVKVKRGPRGYDGPPGPMGMCGPAGRDAEPAPPPTHIDGKGFGGRIDGPPTQPHPTYGGPT